MTSYSNDVLFGRMPKRPATPFVPAIARQPNTTPIPVRAIIKDGRCTVHKRVLSYQEAKDNRCSWCEQP